MKRSVCIAMWSGPRNLSTAMMRSFGARKDTVCVDEPFYAPFLKLTGLEHPMRADILAAHENGAERVIEDLVEPRSDGRIYYQKQMTHHMVAGIDRDWMSRVRNAFLIRHPARVLASYDRKMDTVSLEAIGFPQQLELYDFACEVSDTRPVIIDCDDILRVPETALAKLCDALGIPYDNAMLSWEPGPKPEDGVWGAHWYDSVYASRKFKPEPGPVPEVAAEFHSILDHAMAIYTQLYEARLRLDAPQF